eukprot:2438564-Ditylum_brightwellii.AAC.1
MEGVVQEIRRKWYLTMIRKWVPRQLWDYAGGLGGCIPWTKVTGETVAISEYLDFGFYDKVWSKDNAGLSPQEP